MKHSLLVSGLTWILVGCVSTYPANHSRGGDIVIVDYDKVVSEPLNGLVPPPKLDDLELPSGSSVENPTELHVERMNSYKEYIVRHVESAERLLKEDKIVATQVKRTIEGTLFNCSIPPIPQLTLPSSPPAPLVPQDSTDEDLATAAITYAAALEEHQATLLATIAEGVEQYEVYCH